MADIVNMYFEYYYYLDLIDNGLYNCYDLNYMERAQADADRIHAYFSALIYLFLTVNRLFRNVRSRGTYQTVLL